MLGQCDVREDNVKLRVEELMNYKGISKKEKKRYAQPLLHLIYRNAVILVQKVTTEERRFE